MSKIHVTATVNGDPAEFLTDPGTTLLDALRDELGLTGSKEGCGSGDCGACSILVDGRLVCSCLMLAAEAEGHRIETIEGLAQGGDLHPLQQKFLEHAALQCGFCTPGLLVASKALLDANPDPTEEESALLARRQPLLAAPAPRPEGDPRRARCAAAVPAARPRTEGRMERRTWDRPETGVNFKSVGTRPIRPDGIDKVTGRAAFGADFVMPGMLHGRIKRSPFAHARIVAIDARKALALPGVKAVVTGADFPDLADELIEGGEAASSMRDLAWNVMARCQGALRRSRPWRPSRRFPPAIAESRALERDRGHLRDAAARPRRGALRWATRRAAAARPYLHIRSGGEAGNAIQHRRSAPVRARRRRRRAGRRGGDRRGALHHQGRPPGLHRAARLRRLDDRRRPGPGVELQPGPLHGPHLLRQGAPARHLGPARDARRDRRRLRRQDHGLPGAGRAFALAPGRRAGEAGDEPGRGVSRHRPDQRRA